MRRIMMLAILFASSSAAQASSDDAWAAFEAEVSAACLKAAEVAIEAPKVLVGPYGSERFGLALVSGKAKGADIAITQICVFDKQSKAVELGGELTDEDLKALK